MPDPPTPPPNDSDDDANFFSYEFWQDGEGHSSLTKAIEVKLHLFQSPPRTEAEILDTVTTFARVKDPARGLTRLIDRVTESPSRVRRVPLVAALLAIFRQYVDAFYGSARLSQARLAADEWKQWRITFRVHVYEGLALLPTGGEAGRALVQILALLDDPDHWPPFARDFTGRPPGNPTAHLVPAFRRALKAVGLRDRELQNDFLKYLGQVAGEPERDD